MVQLPDELCLLSQGIDALAEPVSLAGLACAHSVWAKEVQDLPLTRPWGKFLLTGVEMPAPVVVCGPCASSLDVARYLVKENTLPVLGAVFALSQTSGRGQLRRPWKSPIGNIYAAWVWPRVSGWKADLLPVILGWLLGKTLKKQGLTVQIKWPNDILLVNGHKAGGILIEERGASLLVGMGLNISNAPESYILREEWSPVPGILSLSGDKKIRNFWSSLVLEARQWYREHENDDSGESMLPELEKSLAWMGQTVLVHHKSEPYLAVITGLAQDGGLKLMLPTAREEILYSGSISPA